jgi:hypothetical protein
MLNGIVQTQLGQVEVAGPVRTIEEIGSELGYEETKRGGKVECLPEFDVEFFEGDVLPVMRENTVVRHGIEHGASPIWNHPLSAGRIPAI